MSRNATKTRTLFGQLLPAYAKAHGHRFRVKDLEKNRQREKKGVGSQVELVDKKPEISQEINVVLFW